MVFILLNDLYVLSFVHKISLSNYSRCEFTGIFDYILFVFWICCSPTMGELSQGILILGQSQPSTTQIPVINQSFNNELIALASVFISTIPLIVSQFVRLNQDTAKTAIAFNKIRLDEVSAQSQQKDQKISEIEAKLLIANETVSALKEQIVELKSQMSNRSLLFNHVSVMLQICLNEDNLEQIKSQINSILALINQNQQS